MKEVCKRPEERERRSQYMLSGGSVYIRSFIKNQSNEELKLREIVLELYPDFIPQYKVLENKNYTVDLGHPKLKIALEYDGYHHFKN
jgi:hypothetical protein